MYNQVKNLFRLSPGEKPSEKRQCPGEKWGEKPGEKLCENSGCGSVGFYEENENLENVFKFIV